MFVGGIVGDSRSENNYIYINNCYNIGTVEYNGARNGGGVVGVAQRNITKCYNLGNLISSENMGGIVGSDYGVSISDSYYLTGVASTAVAYDANSGKMLPEDQLGKGMPMDKSDMPSILSVVNKDNEFIEDVTNINDGYPVLKWQVE